MEGEKCNLAKAQEKAEKLKQKVESGEASNYGDAEKLVEQDSSAAQSIEKIISQKGFYPEILTEELGLSETQLNKHLLGIWISGRQGYQMRNFFDYIGKHKENFIGIGSLPEGETPWVIKSLIEEAVKAKKPISEVITNLEDIFQIDNQRARTIISDTYEYYSGNQYQTAVFQALQKEFPLTPEESEGVARKLIGKNLEYALKNFSPEETRGEFDFQSFDLIRRQFPEIQRLVEDPEIADTGKKLVKGMLDYACSRDKSGQSRDPKTIISQVVRLYEVAPQFFQDDFKEEVSKVWARMAEYGSFGRTKYGGVDQMSKLLNVLGYPIEQTRPLVRNTLLEKLSSGYYPEGLIEYAKRFGMSDLLSDSEVVSSAKEGRQKALQSLHERSFQEFSKGFGFSEDWKSDPELIEVVKNGVLKRFEGYNNFDEIEWVRQNWCIPQIADDEKIKATVRDKIIIRPYSHVGGWRKRLETFNNWGIPLDSLRDYAKKYIIGELNREDDKLYAYGVEECTRVFPEVMDSPDMREVATRRILDWKYEKEAYGYYRLGETITEISRAIKALHLPPELLDQWKSNIATNLLAEVKDQKQFKEFQEAQRYLKLSPDDLKNVAVDSSLAALSHGELSNALFLENQFSIKLSAADTDKLQKAGVAGLAVALEEGNLANVIKIQEICNLPADFFDQPELREKTGKLLGEQFLAHGEVQQLNEKVNLFGFSESIYSFIDSSAVDHADLSSNLSRFIRFLGDEDFAQRVPKTFERVKELIFSQLAENQDLADYFIENLESYYQQPWIVENVTKAIQQYSVAQKFVYAVENDQTVWKDEPWVADVFSKAQTIVEEHEKLWLQDDDQQQDEYGYSHGSKGFSESDPYENHPWRFGGRQIRIASVISEMMVGRNAEGLKELGIKSNEISPLLAEANEKINTAYQNFLAEIQSNPSIKEDDKQALLNPESSSVRMTPLIDNIRAFVARYFVQSVEGDVTRLSEIGNLTNDLDRIIAEGFRRYIRVHEVDVPLYDKLYEEFDNLRETGRYPLEVFLGRDGIYAWIGRRAQDVARRRKMGLEGRKKLKEMGEVIEIHPQYIVYPRYFRDNLNYETKRQFLEQEGISPDVDPLFYDTGYTGTIPEQIMKVMDFEDEDIEKRIKLLSTPSVHRRVKGISENVRSEIIEYIEHNAKLEETAEGLIIDEKTGKIRHIARPTNPEEQFYFMMVKQAVERHYWLQEKLHHEPSENVNLDSEHYAIRIRQDYAKLLPHEFLHDPKAFFAGHSELMKGGKGEGEYPDEEVTLFKLTDGTEIVAKRIELRKAKEARKEFAILIAAKKAGLPTAEPVGFLSGKEDADGSYLLMKKLEGHSGRKFEKELRESGKYSDEQIKDIMKQVAEKNKEMAELFRTTLKIDKRWRIKDTIIEFNEETGEVESVVPIDWERAQNYNPNTPKEIDEIA